MKRASADLARLARVTEAAFLVAQGALRDKAQAEARAQAELDHLAAARDTVLQTLVLDDSRNAPQVVCHGRWLSWAEQRRAHLNTALARARAKAMIERAAAQKAFGRHKVAEALLERAKTQKRR